MQLSNLIESYRDNIIKSTQQIIRIKSIKGEAKENMPFGEGPYEALKYMLNLGQKLGFTTQNIDNYAGHIEFGDGEEVVGVLVHLDVVPEGEGWTYPPYGGEIHEGKIFGRGTIDDKGPAIATLYAMKALKESGLQINKKVRMILGTDEETGWGGINYYLQKVKAPDIAFTPDADFPVIHGEKGILIFDMKKKLNFCDKQRLYLKEITGGSAPNMVPDTCVAVLEGNEQDKKYVIDQLKQFVQKTNFDISLKKEKNVLILKSKGVSAHGSTPEAGVNAISQLMQFLGKLQLSNQDVQSFIQTYNHLIGMEYNGQSIGCNFEDDVSGKLIFNVGMLRLDAYEATITINIRYPIKVSSEAVYATIKEKLMGTGIEIIEKEDMKPIYVPENHKLVQKLMNVYKKITGDIESRPIVIGGGTYARAMKNAVAFGPLFPGQPALEHQKDECISIESLIKCAKIYGEAIYELAR